MYGVYECEPWTITTKERKILEAFEMCSHWKMLKISCMDRETNKKKVLEKIYKENFYGKV